MTKEKKKTIGGSGINEHAFGNNYVPIVTLIFNY